MFNEFTLTPRVSAIPYVFEGIAGFTAEPRCLHLTVVASRALPGPLFFRVSTDFKV